MSIPISIVVHAGAKLPKEKGLIVEQETSDSVELTHYLVQQEISMEKLDANLGENPSVEQFGTKKTD